MGEGLQGRRADWGQSHRLVCVFLLEVAYIERPLDLRYVRGVALARQHLLPVNFGKEWMPHHLSWVHQALLGVFYQQAEKQVSSHRVVELVEDHILVSDVAEEYLSVLTIERRKPGQHLVQ